MSDAQGQLDLAYLGDRIVKKAAIKIMKAGDGLSEPLALDPVALFHGDEVFFVLRGVVREVDFPPDGKIKEPGDTPPVIRRHTVDALEVFLVDGADVRKVLKQRRDHIASLKAELEAAEQAQREAEAEAMLDKDDGESDRPSELDALGPGGD